MDTIRPDRASIHVARLTQLAFGSHSIVRGTVSVCLLAHHPQIAEGACSVGARATPYSRSLVTYYIRRKILFGRIKKLSNLVTVDDVLKLTVDDDIL